MNIPKLLFNLREEAACPVCQDILKDPRYLPCLHSFCLHCLINWHRASGGQVDLSCPKCQGRSRVPASGDLKDLPSSFFLSGFIDALAIKESDKTQVTCGNCDKRSSKTSYCFECCKFYCDECLIGHKIMRGYKDHRVLTVKDFQEKDYEVVVKRPVFCSRKGHEKEELKFFCKICPEKSVCQTCVILDHAGHKVTLIQEEAEAQKIQIAGVIQTTKDNLEAKMKMVTEIDKDYARLVQRSEDMLRDVDVFVDNLMWRLQAERQNIKTAVENETKKSLENLMTKKAAINQEMKEIESALEKAEKLLTQSTDAEVVQLKKPLQTILDRVGQVKPVERDPESLFELLFVENNKILETINRGGIGLLKFRRATDASESVAEGKGLCEGTVGREAQFVLTTRNSAAEQVYDKNDNVTVDLRDERGQECITSLLVNDKNDGIYKFSYSSSFEGKCSLSVKVNGQHIRDSPFSVIFRSFNVKPILCFGKQGSDDGMFMHPRGLAVNSRDEIAVTSNHKVQIFDCKGNFLRSFGRPGTKRGQFYFPTGIAFGKDRNVYVADTDNHRIQIFNEEGRYISMFGGEGSLDSQVTEYPWGLSVDSNGNIIVADSSNKFIKFFSPDGKFLTKIGGPSFLSYPSHCVQSGNFFIVSDNGDHTVNVFTREGGYKYQFGTRGTGNGKFNHPQCLSVTKSGYVLVCDQYNHRVQVFELKGKFVGKFGKEDSNIGEFKNPFSVALLSNGQIVVSDCGNHRIQIFDEP
ncbi:E3 ubiquitin-protein ligase TRIM71-like [Montipora capricornis]|uniref:E3 ubiquitin-protein ligase TRIM71-like n=1 Tax=Montipora capricornis TaxID=246305 RepID=UPI0035F11C3A